MNMRAEPLSLGRVTFCGSGGGSDCVAARVTDEGKIALSRSHDEGTPPAELVFEGHEIHQFAVAIVNGTASDDVLAAIDSDLARQPA